MNLCAGVGVRASLFDDERGAVSEYAAVHPVAALQVAPHVEAVEDCDLEHRLSILSGVQSFLLCIVVKSDRFDFDSNDNSAGKCCQVLWVQIRLVLTEIGTILKIDRHSPENQV